MSVLMAALLGLWLSKPREQGSQTVVTAYLIASAGVLLCGNLVRHELHDVDAVLFGSAVLVDVAQVGIIGVRRLELSCASPVLYALRLLYLTGMQLGLRELVFATEAALRFRLR